MRTTNLSSILLLLTSSSAIAGPISLHPRDNNDTTITAAQIQAIAPTSNTCDNAPADAKGECSTAEQAAPFISKSFETYKVTSRAEQAALVSLMAFETADFKYNKNHFPGIPGQGTRNMQSPTFNIQYAASIPALASKLSAINANQDPAAVLDLLLADETYDFGSAAWFLTTQCQPDVRSALQSGSEDGWERYITQCVGTTMTDERREYWNRAVQVLGVSSGSGSESSGSGVSVGVGVGVGGGSGTAKRC